MANVLPTSAVVAAKILPIIKEKLMYRSLVSGGISDDLKMELTHRVGETINILRPGTLEAKDFDGEVSEQDIKTSTIPITLDHYLDVTQSLTQLQLQLELQDYMKQVAEPMAYALAVKADRRVSNHIFQYATNYVAENNDTEKLTAISDCGLVLDNAPAPINDRYLVMSPTHKHRYALKDQLSKVSYAGSNETLREAMLGRVYGFDTMDTTITPRSSATTNGTAKTKFKVESGATSGKVKITELSSATATVKAGEGFCYGDRKYTFTENGAGAASAISEIAVINDDGNTFPEDVEATEVRMIRGATSIAFQKDAFVFVPVPLEGVAAGEGVDTAVATEDGLSIRVSRWYDARKKKHLTSMDILFAIGDIRPENAAVIVDSF